MELQRLKINSVLSLAQMRQVAGSCQVILDRADVTRFERQGREFNRVSPTEPVVPAECIVMTERDAHLEKSSSVRKTSRTPSLGPSCSTAATFGSLDRMDINPRIMEDDFPRRGVPTKGTVAKKSKKRNMVHSGRHSCLFCEKEWRKWSDLEIHMRVHTDERPFTCPLCQAPFTAADHLNRHQRTVHSKAEKKFACGHCGMWFHFNYQLKRHESVHSFERLFSCNLCGKSFRRKDQLEIHLRFHTGERPYKCELCQKRFITSGELTKHKFTHGPVTLRPYKCTMCPKAFYDKTQLTDHVNQHIGEKPYKCEMCEKVYPSAQSLRKHRQTKGHRPADNKSCGVPPSA